MEVDLMFDSTSFALFFIASWALIITPGPDMLYVITRGIAQGRRAGLHSAFGVTSGLLVHTLLAALGLAALLQTSAIAFLVIKYVGAAYLIYLGIQSFRAKRDFERSEQQKPIAARAIFWQGFISNVTNPKISIFFLAFLPQFVQSDRGSFFLQMLILGLLFAVFGIAFLSVIGAFAGQIGGWLSNKPALVNRFHWLTGGVLIGLGIRLAFVERR
jgi:threonine/homoserine/homoserine lactone efflux protein